jgi:tetratricopeptide (TPR) repeat protein
VHVAWPFGPGVLGGSLARIGIGDIETYDPVGTPTGSASFGDVEVAAGYALGLTWPLAVARPDEMSRTAGLVPGARGSSAFDVGFSFRMRRQSFGGEAATGIGLDFGLAAHPRPSLDLGLRMRNLLSPALTLGAEAERLPRSLALGASYSRPLLGRPLLVTAETGFGGGTAPIAAGAEIQIAGNIAGRVGLAGSSPRFGVGFTAGFLAFDYGVESHDLGLMHLASVTVRLGEGAADRVARERLQAEAERSAVAGAAAERALTAASENLRSRARATEDPAVAEAAWLAILAQRPGDAEAQAALAEIEAQQTAAVQDSVVLRQRERETTVTRLRAEAEMRETAGDPAGAAAAWGRILAVSPDDPTVVENLGRVRDRLSATADSLVATRQDLGVRAAEIERLGFLVRALEAYAGGKSELATATLDSLLVIHPQDETALALRAQIAPSSALTDPRVREEARRLYVEGMRLFNTGDYAGAIRYWEDLLALDPANSAVRLNLEEARIRLRSGE